MATVADFATPAYAFAPRPARAAEARFFERYTLGLVLLVVFGFGQFELRGLADLPNAPWWVHLHAAVMTAWLGLLLVQPRLAGAASGDAARIWHRRLGWAGAVLMIAIMVLGVVAAVGALRLHRVPPFFAPGYFLALSAVEAAMFGFLVMSGVARRGEALWHRRLMIGASLILLEPALGRLLPMPFLGWAGEWLVMICQLLAVTVIARHDIRQFGRTHPATLGIGAVVVGTHVAVTLIALLPPVQALAAGLAAG